MVAKVLNTLSKLKLSVLTIHQSIPMDGSATIALSLDGKDTDLDIDEEMESLKMIERMSNVELISMTIEGSVTVYAYRTGTITVLNPPHVVLEAAGVGYEIQTPNSYRFQKYKDQDILIHTSLIVREDAQLLYGFYNQEEKDMFLSLIKVTGIGPKSALAIL